MSHVGELAALATAVCWAAGSNFFAAAGQRMGSWNLNTLRITTAMFFLGIALWALRGSPLPFWATGPQVGFLAVSGLVGFVFGDANYFRSLVILGPSRAALLASLAPLFTALLGWPLLGEIPGRLAVLGMALTLGGIFWVLYEREKREHPHIEGSPAVGVMAGVLAAVGQAVGYILSKFALRTGLDPLSATVVRVCAAVIAVWVIALSRRDTRRVAAALRDRVATWFMIAGAFCGPFLGVTMSLVALQHIQAGIASSITAIYPVLTLLIASRFHGEKLTPRALFGTAVAVAGVVVLFLRWAGAPPGRGAGRRAIRARTRTAIESTLIWRQAGAGAPAEAPAGRPGGRR